MARPRALVGCLVHHRPRAADPPCMKMADSLDPLGPGDSYFLSGSPPAARGRPAVDENGGFLASLERGQSYFLSGPSRRPGRAYRAGLGLTASLSRASTVARGGRRPAQSVGLACSHLSIDRQPRPMHRARPARRRSSSAIRSSIRFVQALEMRARPGASAPGGRKLGEFRADLLERQSDPLGKDDERDPARCAGIAATAGAGVSL